MISEVGIGEDVLETWIGIYETKLGGIIVNIMNSNRYLILSVYSVYSV